MNNESCQHDMTEVMIRLHFQRQFHHFSTALP